MSRRSLRTRLVILSVALVTCAIATTAAIVSLSTTASIQQRYRQDIASDAEIYNTLLGYAATHPSWSTMTPAQLRKIGSGAGQITITDTKRRVLVTSDPGTPPLAADTRPAAVVDALSPDANLSRSPQPGGIDARAEGPFLLSAAERQRIDEAAAKAKDCLAKLGAVDITALRYPNGRTYLSKSSGAVSPYTTVDDCGSVIALDPGALSGTGTPLPPSKSGASGDVGVRASGDVLTIPTRRELTAAIQLTSLFQSCLRTAHQSMPSNYPLIKQVDFLPVLVELKLSTPAETCLGTARRTQLASYVAPPAMVFISGSVATELRPGLSRSDIQRIVLAATAILLIAVVAVLLAASGISRPLRTLTGAVDRMRRGEQQLPVPATGTKEVATLTAAFNDMSAELVRAEARRKEMISDVAHELRTPLGNVRGWLEAVQDGLATPDPPLIASLLDESRLLQSIIDDLQVLALADTDRLVVHPEPIDLGDVLEQVVAAQRLNATAKGLRLELVRGGDLSCSADPGRVRQAIGNLVTNAIRYTDGGTVTITADGTQSDILLAVADTGPGISPEDLPHIFDRFWRAEKSRDRRSGGSGLGLAITEHLVRAHGGRIEARSELGRGTTVSVHLPRER